MHRLLNMIVVLFVFAVSAGVDRPIHAQQYVFSEEAGGWVDAEAGLVWGYDLAGITTIVNWDYDSAEYFASTEGYVTLLLDHGWVDQAAVASQFEWRVPSLAEVEGAIEKDLFSDPTYLYGVPDVSELDDPNHYYFFWGLKRWTSDSRGKQHYRIVPATGVSDLGPREGIGGGPLVVRSLNPDGGDGGGNGNGNGGGKGKNK